MSAPQRPYKEGNVDADGDYVVGKGRTPESTRFRAGDGRKRGKRKKGVANFETDLMAEAETKTSLSEGGGETVRVTKQRALIKKSFDRAFKGSDAAIRELFSQLRAAHEGRAEREGRRLRDDDRSIIDEYFDDLIKGLGEPADDPEIGQRGESS